MGAPKHAIRATSARPSRRRRALRLAVPAMVVAGMAGPLAFAATTTASAATTSAGSRIAVAEESGQIQTFPATASGNVAPSAVISLPSGQGALWAEAVSPSTGALWVATNSGSSGYLDEYTPSQLVTTGRPTPTATVSGVTTIGDPLGLAFDSSGNLWVATQKPNSAVVELSAKALAAASGVTTVTPTAVISGNNTTLVGPQKLAFDSFGDLWVTTGSNNTVVEFSHRQLGSLGSSNDITPAHTIAGAATGLAGVVGIGFDPSGDLWVVDNFSSTVLGGPGAEEFSVNQLTNLSTSGPNVAPVASDAGGTSGFQGPYGASFAPGGNLWVTDGGAHAVSELTSTQLGSLKGANGVAPANVVSGGQTGIVYPSDVVSLPAYNAPTPTIGPATKLAFLNGTPPSTVSAGQTFTATVAVEDAKGAIETADSTDQVTLSDSSTTLSCTNRTQTVKNGETAFTCSVPTTGSDNVWARSGSLTQAAAAVDVLPTASSLVIAPVSNQTAGVPFTVSVSVDTSSGSAATADNTTQITLSGSGVTCASNTVTATNGVANFGHCVIGSPGTAQLRATAVAGVTVANPTVLSNTFTVATGSASHETFVSVPSTVTAGQTFSVKVGVTDSSGNPVGDYPVSLKTTPTDVLLGTATATTGTSGATDGIATFTGLSIDKAGTYQLVADGPTATTTITVKAAGASTLAFTHGPANAAVGGTLAPVVVQVEDAYGNPVVDNGLAVSVSSSPAGLEGSPVLGSTDNAGTATFNALTFGQAGTYTLTATGGALGNATSSPFTITKATPTVTVTGSPNPSNPGSITYAVTVASPTGAAVPSGSVTVTDGTNTCGPVTLNDGQGSCALTEHASATAYTVTAKYSGDANYTAAQGTTTESVNQESTVTSITGVTSTSTTYGAESSETFTVQVAPTAGGANPTGSVDLTDATTGSVICTATLQPGAGDLAGGSCTPKAADAMPGGTNQVDAIYLGDIDHSGSTSSMTTITVAKAATTTTVVPSANPATTGPVTYTVTVSGPGASPTGTVTVGDGAAGSCTAVKLAGAGAGKATARCTISEQATGSPYTVTAAYSGDGNDKGSKGSVTETVDKFTPTVVVTESANPGVTGAVTYFVHVVGRTGGVVATTPAGTSVSVTDQHTTCTTLLVGGKGSCVLDEQASLSPYQVTASYPGDANYTPATSTIVETVHKAATTTSLSTSTGSLTYGQEGAETFTVTVAGAPVGPSPSGQVDVYAGTTPPGKGTAPLCVVTLAGAAGGSAQGTCSLTPDQRPVGTTHLVAVYPGDGNYLPSSNTVPESVTVAKALPVVTVSAEPTTATSGTVTYGVAVTGTTGGAVPTGSVTISDGVAGTGHACTIAALSATGAGHCSIVEAKGAYTVTASYSGDGTYRPATGTLAETVGAATPTVTLQMAHATVTYGHEGRETVTVTVAGPSVQPVPGGTVSLVATGPGATTSTLDTVDLVNGTGSFTFPRTELGGGSYMLQATYGGNADYSGAASATSPLTVKPNANASVEVTTRSTGPGTVTFSATVLGLTHGAQPTGTVTIDGGADGTCTVTLNDGIGTCTLTEGAGTYHFVASYSGDANYAGQPGTVDFTVDQAAPSVSLSVKPASASYGSEGGVTFAVTVAGSSAQPVPSGAVTIDTSVGGKPTTLCTITMTKGSGSCTLTADQLLPGSYPVTAAYSGDSNYTALTSKAQQLTIDPATPTITLTSVDPTTAGAVMYTAAVSGPAGAAVPAGSVTITDNAGGSCTNTLSGGTASCAIDETGTAGGTTYQLTVSYTPSGGLYGAVSDDHVGTETVDLATAPMTLNGPSTLTYGGESTAGYGYTVAGVPGLPAPAGTVVVSATAAGSKTAVTLCSAAAANGGCGITSGTVLAPGTYQVTAAYQPGSGSSYAPASAGPNTLTVTKAASAVAITAPTAPQAGMVTYQVTVTDPSATPPALVVPSGKVVVSDGQGGSCTIAKLDTAGAGSCAIAEAAGTYQVSASYHGDAFDTIGTGGPITVTVKPDTYTTVLGLSPAAAAYGGEGAVSATVTLVPTGTASAANGTATVTTTVGKATETLCTATISSGSGSCTLSSPAAEALVPGTYQVVATYTGSGSSRPSTAQALTVVAASPAVTVTGSPDPATLPSTGGKATVTYAVTVAPLSPDAAVPAGTVTVTAITGSGSSTVTGTCGPATLAAGATDATASCTIGEPAAGTYKVTASYTPGKASTGLYVATASPVATETVDAAPAPVFTGVVSAPSTVATTTTLLQSDPGVVAGSENTDVFSVSVTSSAGVPTGTANIETAAGSVICTATLANGSGTCSPLSSALAVGSHSVHAVYGGTSTFAGSSSGAQTLTVGPAPATLAAGSGSLGSTIAAATSSGYRLVGANGAVFAFGGAAYAGGGNTVVGGTGTPIVATVTDPAGGYWLVGQDGAVFGFGGAGYFGGANTLPGGPGTAIVGMAATADGGGYWLVGQDGAVYGYGDAGYFGGANPLPGGPGTAIVGMAATADGGGYWLVGADGAVYGFGNAGYQGGANTGAGGPGTTITGIAADPTGGYWLVGADGSVFGYGAPKDLGEPSSLPGGPGSPIVAIVSTADGGGYWMIAANGAVFAYGDAGYAGGGNTIPGGTGTTMVGGARG